MLDGDMGRHKPTRFLLLSEYWRLLLEVCYLTEEIRPRWTTLILREQIIELSRPILQNCESCENDEQILKLMLKHFFQDCHFRFLDQITLQKGLLPKVLSKRQGPAPLLMLLLATLLEEAGLRVQILSCRTRHLFRVYVNGRPIVIDMDQQGRPLNATEILELINAGFDFSKGSLAPHQMVIEYLEQLRLAAEKVRNWQVVSLIHSYLMRYQPFNLKHLKNRAILAYETGDYRRAVEDIRSYFQYKQPGLSPDPLKKIYKLARRRQQLDN